MQNRRIGLLSLDPRTKIILLIGVNVFIFTNSCFRAEIAVIVGLTGLMLLCGVYRAALKSITLYTALVVIQLAVLPLCPKLLISSMTIIVITCRKLLPCVMLGTLLVRTTPIRLLMYALQKWHLPQAVIIPLAITVRYFPTLREEYEVIRDAVRLRNIRGPLKKIEHIFVPLMLSASSTADELSQAIIARGIDHPGTKTCSVELKFNAVDDGLCMLAAGLVLFSLFLR